MSDRRETDMWESIEESIEEMIFRFLFFNRHVGVIYSCLAHSSIGKCEERAIYVISRHESIDHAELTVLETVAKSVCVDPQVLYHTAAHGMSMLPLF
uniref:Vacuolar fusion protein MON1 homolog n=1 Tax=Heterorhabditis bacteriophora TaxID=37862 RepID=A0A1I7XAC4_HETBA